MPKGGKHGNLSASASRVYEAIRRDHPNMTKKSAARIANSVTGVKKSSGRKKGKR